MKKYVLVLILLLVAPLAEAGIYYSGFGFHYTTKILMENLSIIGLPGGTAWVGDDYNRLFEFNVSSENESQLVGLSVDFSSDGRVYGVDCIIHLDGEEYFSPATVYNTTSGYLASCDFRGLGNEIAGILGNDPSYVRFMKAGKFNLSLRFVVEDNATVHVHGIRTYLYHSELPTNFVILETPNGYALKVEPVAFSGFDLRMSARGLVNVKLLGSDGGDDYFILPFRLCNGTDYDSAGVSFYSHDPRFPYHGPGLFVRSSACSNKSNPRTTYNFKRRWAVIEGVYVERLGDLRGIIVSGTLYEPLTRKDEFRYWLPRLGLSLVLGIILGIGIGWALWKRSR